MSEVQILSPRPISNGTKRISPYYRVIRPPELPHFLPGNNDPDAKNWNMENGGIMIEFDAGGWVGYGPADEELFFVARGEL